MLIVATAGGGIRAAYWTATVLEKLARDFEKEGGVRPYLFAISGVSGGSVGATAFDAALAQRDENQCAAGDATCPLATTFLTADFLAPALASLFFLWMRRRAFCRTWVRGIAARRSKEASRMQAEAC